MIDWLGVATNSLWVLGLAGMLAAASYYDYVAWQQGRSRRAVLTSSPFVFYLSLSAAIFCAGVALSGGAWWERIAWGLLAILCAWQAWQKRGAERDGPAPPANAA